MNVEFHETTGLCVPYAKKAIKERTFFECDGNLYYCAVEDAINKKRKRCYDCDKYGQYKQKTVKKVSLS
jgi:hypothetical protein